MKNKHRNLTIDMVSPRSPAMQPILKELYSFDEYFDNWHTVGLDGEFVGNDKTPFVDGAPIMCMGCSFTSGEGLPEQYSWPSIIRTFTGKPVNNCSMRGASIPWLIYAGIDVLKTHGMPQKVFALWPDLDRALVHQWQGAESQAVHAYWDCAIGAFTQRSENGRPVVFELEDARGDAYLVEREMAIFQSFMMLDVFDSLLGLSGVDFTFTPWQQEAYEAFEELSEKYPSFLASEHWGSQDSGLRYKLGSSSECQHEPLSGSQERFWDLAADNRHPGLHDQIHIAEHFLQTPISMQALNGLP